MRRFIILRSGEGLTSFDKKTKNKKKNKKNTANFSDEKN